MSALKGQIAVVTGATSGIGKAIAHGLLAEGATVVLVGRDAKRIDRVVEEAGAPPARVARYVADLTVETDLMALTGRLRTDLPHLDLLVHSAGGFAFGRTEAARVEDLDWLYRINLRAPFVMTRDLLPMLKARHGQIVFINSSLAVSARAEVGQYGAMKQALKGLADSLRAEVNDEGVRVLSVYVGRTATPMQELVHKYERRAYDPERLLQPEDVAGAVVQVLKLPRTAEVTDLQIRPMQKSVQAG